MPDTRRDAPYWWPDTQSVLQIMLAIAIIIMVGYILFALLEAKVTLEQAQRDLLMILFGIVLGCFKDVYGFTYGSSAGGKAKDEVISKSIETKDKIIADNVVATAALAAGTGNGTISEDALKAAAAVAPVAAAVAAPPAAEDAAPAAAKVAVEEALKDKDKPGN